MTLTMAGKMAPNYTNKYDTRKVIDEHDAINLINKYGASSIYVFSDFITINSYNDDDYKAFDVRLSPTFFLYLYGIDKNIAKAVKYFKEHMTESFLYDPAIMSIFLGGK